MKKLAAFFLLCALSTLAPLRAQPATADSLSQFLNHLFAPLDKSQVPAPFLEEYGRRFVPLDVLNGTLTDSSRTSIQAFRLAYASVLTGALTANTPLPSLADLNARLSAQEAASEAISIIVQRVDYAALRPDALTAGLLSAQNGQLHDAPNRPRA